MVRKNEQKWVILVSGNPNQLDDFKLWKRGLEPLDTGRFGSGRNPFPFSCRSRRPSQRHLGQRPCGAFRWNGQNRIAGTILTLSNLIS
jgi:hypothetical protein